ncbi:polysaccharide biosynthesis tyrosine autokinase [Paraburkholderia sp. BCC1884]|uniref:polysaccharide biosynthesis tyrosine autokinase n=1 Tax=Paraburkholderia sp. BCC1884 TaxID=2562668 RepID=UPI0011846070|nr:polysaccharide biosynthesis tyrosine autokinase [Paraburkholderia sp. BCC1884]
MSAILDNESIGSHRMGGATLASHLSHLAHSWRLIGATTAVALVLGVGYAYVATPVYQADAMIQVEDSESTAKAKETLGELASIFNKSGTTAAEMELIHSDLVIAQAVQQLHLDISAKPKYFPVIGAALARHAPQGELAPARFGMPKFAWGGEQISLSALELPSSLASQGVVLTAAGDGAYTLATRAGSFILRAQVGQLASVPFGDGRVVVKVDQLVAHSSTEFEVMKMSEQSTIETLKRSLSIAEKAKQSGMIGVSLTGEHAGRTADILNAITQQYVKQNVDRKSAEAEHTLAFLEQQLPQLRAELDTAEEKYNQFRNENGTIDQSEESKLLLEQISQTEVKTLDLQQQRDDLSQRFAPGHTAITSLDAQLARLHDKQAELNQQVQKLPGTEQNSLRLLRDVRVDTQLYTDLLNSAQQLRVLKAGQVGDVRVVNHATIPEAPIRPNLSIILLGATIAGLMVGVVVASGRKMLVGGIESSNEIEHALGIPVFAVVPRSPARKRLQQSMKRGDSGQHVLAGTASYDVAVEGLRTLRTAFQFGMIESSSNVIAVTGTGTQVGKSFVSINFASVMALGGKRVILVDGDMRRGDIHQYLNIKSTPGLSDVLSGMDIDRAVVKDVLPGLDVLPQGTVPGNPSELLMGERYKDMIEHLSRSYDVVIVDTPPTLAVTDAALIGKSAGATLLVVRHGKDQLFGIGEAVRRLRHSGIAVKGVVFTDVPRGPLGYGAYFPDYYSSTAGAK